MSDEPAIDSASKAPVPFLKWPGGKRWLALQLKELCPEISEISGRYIEPFLGGGAVFFHLRPGRAILNDLNDSLIHVYRVVRDQPEEIVRFLRRHNLNHSAEYYYKVRKSTPSCRVGVAARFLYLNRTCFNGLYRVNRLGHFNVPIGTKTSVILPNDDFFAVSKALKKATLRCADFASVIDQSERDDLVFADPPYTVNHNLNGFLRYNEKLFSWNDQQRLHDAAARAIARGARVIITNADHASVRNLYSEKIFALERVTRHSKLSGQNDGRKKTTELLIRSR